jgi:hypothetical protein
VPHDLHVISGETDMDAIVEKVMEYAKKEG